MQLISFTRAPRTMTVGADLPFTLLSKEHGAGAGFFNESIGLFRNQRFWAQYAYRLTLGKSKLSMGLQLGMLSVGFDPSALNLGDESGNDEAFPATAENGMSLDVGAGASLLHPRFYVSFSAHHLSAPRIRLGERSDIRVRPMLYFTGGYNIQTRNPLVSIQPSLHLQSDITATRLDLTTRLFYTYRSKRFYGGLTYTPDTSVGIHLGVSIRNVTIGYAYEWFTSKIGAAGGSHDIAASYAFDLNAFKKSRNLHKSIRVL
jgi:type IX secretion system PorP/SprF family membrane protein